MAAVFSDQGRDDDIGGFCKRYEQVITMKVYLLTAKGKFLMLALVTLWI
ncbi:MAG: hypothetical protein AAF564_18625 [Bacteroidota bacterium]